MRSDYARRERRNRYLIVACTGLVLALIGGAVGWAILSQRNQPALTGVSTFDGLTSNHAETPVTYAQTPAVGGDHSATLQNCGVYPTPVGEENAVHSLEHGAVWITYQPALPADQVTAITDLAAGQTHILVSPYPGLPSPVVASAWGVQLPLDSAADPRLEQFVKTYQRGPQTPEPGAPCSGGAGTP
ncbi:MAG: DUF3105 domain-containing protein [Candidatus Nanopelagicales bacterium]